MFSSGALVALWLKWRPLVLHSTISGPSPPCSISATADPCQRSRGTFPSTRVPLWRNASERKFQFFQFFVRNMIPAKLLSPMTTMVTEHQPASHSIGIFLRFKCHTRWKNSILSTNTGFPLSGSLCNLELLCCHKSVVSYLPCFLTHYELLSW